MKALFQCICSVRSYIGVQDNMANCLFFSSSLSVSLPSYISHSFSISLMLPFSPQSGTPHLHISLTLSSLASFSLSLSAALAQGKLFLPSSSCPSFLPCLLPPYNPSSFSSCFLISSCPCSLSPFLVSLHLSHSSFPPPLTIQSPLARMCGWWCLWCCCWCQRWLCLYSSTSAPWATTAVWLTAEVRGLRITHTKTHTQTYAKKQTRLLWQDLFQDINVNKCKNFLSQTSSHISFHTSHRVCSRYTRWEGISILVPPKWYYLPKQCFITKLCFLQKKETYFGLHGVFTGITVDRGLLKCCWEFAVPQFRFNKFSGSDVESFQSTLYKHLWLICGCGLFSKFAVLI